MEHQETCKPLGQTFPFVTCECFHWFRVALWHKVQRGVVFGDVRAVNCLHADVTLRDVSPKCHDNMSGDPSEFDWWIFDNVQNCLHVTKTGMDEMR